MAKTLTLGLAGKQFSGKSSVVKVLSGYYGDDLFAWSGSGYLKGLLDEQEVEHTRENYSAIAMGLRTHHGPEIMARLMREAVPNPRPRILLCDGLRWIGAVEEMWRLFPDFRLLYLHASLQTRFARAQKLTEGKDGRVPVLTYDDFLQDEILASEDELPELLQMADAVIDAEKDSRNVIGQIDAYIDQWLT